MRIGTFFFPDWILSGNGSSDVNCSANGGKEDIYPIRNENNQKEYFRLSELQFVVRSLYGCNVIAPIDPNPQLILDAGTGSGNVSRS